MATTVPALRPAVLQRVVISGTRSVPGQDTGHQKVSWLGENTLILLCHRHPSMAPVSPWLLFPNEPIRFQH
jgi:hypothetical protein